MFPDCPVMNPVWLWQIKGKTEKLNELLKVMTRTIYLHQQGICGRTGLLVSCTIGNNCAMYASGMPAGSRVCVCVHMCQQCEVQLAVAPARTGGAEIMPREKLPSASLAALWATSSTLVCIQRLLQGGGRCRWQLCSYLQSRWKSCSDSGGDSKCK